MNENSKISGSSTLYTDTVVKNSVVGDNCIIGDFSRVYESKLEKFSRVDRNNFLLKSKLGEYSYTGQFTVIMHSEIGKFCSISWGVTIGAGEHDYSKLTTHDFLYNPVYGLSDGHVSYDRFNEKMEIGNDVWIGTNSTICRGVKIGNGAVVGANSVVTKDVPPYAIVAGCPARIIKYRFDENIIDRLESLKWWDFPISVVKKYFSEISRLEINVLLDLMEEERK